MLSNKVLTRHIFLVLSLSILLHLVQSGAASPLPGTDEWNSGFIGERAWEHVKILTSDSLGGRYSGFHGADKAEKYIADHFKELNLLEPFGKDGYFNNFTYGAGEYAMPSSLLTYFPDGTIDTAYMWEDYNIYKYSGFGKVRGRVFFAGYGISAPQKGWDELAGFDLTGRIVLTVRGVPDLTGVAWGVEGASGYKSTSAMDQGAVGFLMTQNDPPKYATIKERFYRKSLPAAWISGTLADKLLQSAGMTKDQLMEELNSGKKPVSCELDVEVELQISGQYYPERAARNVAAILPGADPELRSELVIIGAHMDHHGTDAAGHVYPGADDNASGTSAMMELSTIFSALEDKPARSIMFIGFAAEEEGLAGSEAFVKSLPVEGYEVVAMLNMDMVGQGSGEVGIGGMNEFEPLEQLFISWQDSTLEEIKFWGLHGSSDHASFADAGIPSYVIGAPGEHPNYHTPYDTAGAIKPEILKIVGDMMFHTASYLADYKGDLKQFAGIERHLKSKHTGTSVMGFDDLMVMGIAWKRIGLEGVPYSDPFTFVRTKPLISATDPFPFVSAEYEIDRENRMITGNQINFWGLTKGNGDHGVSLILPSPDCIPSMPMLLDEWVRSGVGFVEIIANDFNLSDRTDAEIAELASVCRYSGVRPFATIGNHSQYDEIARIVSLWGGQGVCLADPRNFDWTQIDKLVKAGCFILFDFSGSKGELSQDIADQLVEQVNGNHFASIGIISNDAVISKLLEADVRQSNIANLMKYHLTNKLAAWQEDSEFELLPEELGIHRAALSTTGQRQWWID